MQIDQFVTTVERLLTEQFRLFLSIAVLILAFIAGLLVRRYVSRLLHGFDVPEAVEGTPFERYAQRLGTSTVGLLSNLSGLFILVVGAIIAVRIAEAVPPELLSQGVTNFLRQVFIAVVVLIVGFISGDKAELYFRDQLKGVKVPEINVLPRLVKYSIFYVAALIALDQLGVATTALLVLLAAYAFGVFFIGGLATKDLLMSASAGVYLLLTEPYAIGDRVEVDGHRGIVQEVDTFATRIESNGEEYIIPNHRVFKDGIVVVRD